MVREFDSALIQSQELRLALWAEHFSVPFSWPAARVSGPRMVANKPMKLDTSPVSKRKVGREISFLKGHRADGPDGLLPSPSRMVTKC